MAQETKLLSKEFIALNSLLFLAFCNMSVFFQFNSYLHTLPIAPKWFGLLIGVFSFTSLVVRPFLSPILTPLNSKKYITFGLVLMGFALLAYKYFNTCIPVMALRVFHGLGHVFLVTAVTTLMMLFIPKGKSGNAFGIVMNVNLLPYALLPPFMGFLSREMGGFPEVLSILAVFMFCFLPVVFLVKPPQNQEEKSVSKAHKISKQEIWKNFKNPTIIVLLLIYLLIYMGYAPVFFFLKKYATNKGISEPGLFFTIAVFSMIAIRLLAMPLADKWGRKKFFAGSMAILAISFPCLGYAENDFIFFGLAVFMGAGWGMAAPLTNSIMFQVSAPKFRGLNTNYLMEMQQAGFFAGPFLGGFIVATFGYEALFVLSGAFAALAIGLMPLLRVKEDQ